MEELKTICKNPWCKGTFYYVESDMIDCNPPTQCKKCKSFCNELSAGVEWKTKEYEGSRNDGTPHEIKYRVTNFKL